MNELVGARQGEPQSRSRLVERVLPTVVQWCARLGGPKVNAEDAAHDVMIVVITKLPVFDAPGRFGEGSPAALTITTSLLRSTGPPRPRGGVDDRGVHAGA